MFTQNDWGQTNQNKRNRTTKSERRDQKNTLHPFSHENACLESKQQQQR